jgi:hypothetical protein
VVAVLEQETVPLGLEAQVVVEQVALVLEHLELQIQAVVEVVAK